MRAEGLVWAHRACSEAAASIQYRRLSCALRMRAAKNPFVTELEAASTDERRHSLLCAERAQKLGWRGEVTPLVTPEVSPFKRGSGAAMLFESVATFCIGESLNAALLQLELERAEDAATARLTRELLRDEIRHANLGFRFLEAAAARADLRFLRRPLALACRASFATEAARPTATLVPLPQRAELLRDTLRMVVAPALERCALRLEWESAYLAA